MQTNTLKFGFVSLGFFVVHRSRLFLCLDFFFGLFCSVFGIEFNFGPFFPNLIVCSYVFCSFFSLKKKLHDFCLLFVKNRTKVVSKRNWKEMLREKKKTLVPMKSEKKSHNQKSAPNTTKFFLYSFEAWASNTFAKAKCWCWEDRV